MRLNHIVIELVLAAILLSVGFPVEAQQSAKVPRIGYLSPLDPDTDAPRSDSLRAALREFGYIEGQSIAVEYRYMEGKQDRFSQLAADLVRLKVDLIIAAGGDPAIRAARMRPRRSPSL